MGCHHGHRHLVMINSDNHQHDGLTLFLREKVRNDFCNRSLMTRETGSTRTGLQSGTLDVSVCLAISILLIELS